MRSAEAATLSRTDLTIRPYHLSFIQAGHKNIKARANQGKWSFDLEPAPLEASPH